MIRIRDISLPAREDGEDALRRAVSKSLQLSDSALGEIRIRRRSVDARRKNDVRVIYTVDVDGDTPPKGKSNISLAENCEYTPPRPSKTPENPPVIVGFGPAGMFAALVLSEAGLRPIVLERGLDVDSRTRSVEAFWTSGPLDGESNVQFGEGGAGAFSDGKLNTGIKNPRIGYVLDTFVRFGARKNVAYDAKPHVGTDRLKVVVRALREHVISLGADVRFTSRLTGFRTVGGRVTAVTVNDSYELPCESLILAVGHSARDTLETLERAGVPMEPKAFAMGARIEHLQRRVDAIQYGPFAGLKTLGAADYKLVAHTAAGSAYTFCMCPGGYVVAAASEPGMVCTNGMSYSGRGGENANSALLVGLDPSDFPYPGPLGGMRWQRELERRAFEAGGGNYFAPVQTVGDFLGPGAEPSVAPTYRPGVKYTDLHGVLPKRITDTLELALPEFDRRIPGFADPGAVLTAVESRSSSPVRVLRDVTRQSPIRGLWPCGEGAGYAGGITSAAIDGILTAEALIGSLR